MNNIGVPRLPQVGHPCVCVSSPIAVDGVMESQSNKVGALRYVSAVWAAGIALGCRGLVCVREERDEEGARRERSLRKVTQRQRHGEA